MRPHRFLVLAVILVAACRSAESTDVLTFSGSAVGREGEIVRRQLERFAEERGVRVEVRATPDAADQRHQLYVQWLNARSADPDVLQLDVIWTPEFAAAGWILPLDRFNPAADAFFPSTIAANRWAGALYAVPWFVDVGMLYWRTDLLERPPDRLETLAADVSRARERGDASLGFVWQGARYEGLVTVFLEYLGGFGGRILDEAGRVVVNSEAGVGALTLMRDAIYQDGIVPLAVLTWHEEETRFAFQNGEAVLMRNWPYAFSLLEAQDSRVRSRFGVAPMPAAAGGTPTATLGGSQLAINAHTLQPDAAYALIEYLTRPEQMIERAQVIGQYPARQALYETDVLDAALGISAAEAERIIEAAVPRPVTPVYTELSEILQIQLHRALTRQQEPRPALEDAAREMRALLARVGLGE